ncbi:hypothetical protein [Mycolicibacterium sp. XJ1819]
MTDDVEKRFDRPETFRAAIKYVGVVVALTAVVFAIYAFFARESVVVASAVPGLLMLGGIGAFVKTYRQWRARAAWFPWQGAGWFLLILTLVCLAVPGAAINASYS